MIVGDAISWRAVSRDESASCVTRSAFTARLLGPSDDRWPGVDERRANRTRLGLCQSSLMSHESTLGAWVIADPCAERFDCSLACRDQLGFVQAFAIPYGLLTPGGTVLLDDISEARIGSQNVDEVEDSVPDTVALAVSLTCTHSA